MEALGIPTFDGRVELEPTGRDALEAYPTIGPFGSDASG
jgi:hypothetical protein